jgi:hypothetical protein
MEIGLACATFGLIFGGLVGGPIARFLVWKNKLTPDEEGELTVGFRYKEHEIIDVDGILRVLLIIAIAIGLGVEMNDLLEHWGLMLPDFVACLFAGIILTNTVPRFLPKYQWPSNGSHSLALVSDLSLGLFLSMSLMSLQLWMLADLAGPMLLLFGLRRSGTGCHTHGDCQHDRRHQVTGPRAPGVCGGAPGRRLFHRSGQCHGDQFTAALVWLNAAYLPVILLLSSVPVSAQTGQLRGFPV